MTNNTIWFTADTHFGHAAIIKHCYRPFASVEEMDATILSRLNRCAKPTDDLYHLGDFAFAEWRSYRDLIDCQKIHLIVGNHDQSKQLKAAIKSGLFESISYYTRLKQGKRGSPSSLRLILCHYPLRFWEPGYIHLHGHTHGSLLPLIAGRRDVGVDAQSFSPVPLSMIAEIPMRDRLDGRHGNDRNNDFNDGQQALDTHPDL